MIDRMHKASSSSGASLRITRSSAEILRIAGVDAPVMPALTAEGGYPAPKAGLIGMATNLSAHRKVRGIDRAMCATLLGISLTKLGEIEQAYSQMSKLIAKRPEEIFEAIDRGESPQPPRTARRISDFL